MIGRYEIVVAAHFDAAHRLPGYSGPCSRLHGHRWEVEAAVTGPQPGAEGMVVDFLVLKRILGEIVEAFDHRCLNEVEPFTEISPTSENLAGYLYQEFVTRVAGLGVGIEVCWVSVSESPDTKVVYRGGTWR